jgi:tetratricopeptide (TPR) repeat protein
MLTPARTIEAYLQMGISLSLQDKHQHAIKYYEWVLALDSRNITALINLANCYNLDERYEDSFY